MKKVTVIQVVVGASSTLTTGFEKYFAAIGINVKSEQVQKTALLGTVRILRLVLG